MGRWEPNARGRLQEAALALYGERGFEQVTVAEIARRAGLTERTYFRYFADKREVLFGGSEILQELMVGAVREAPAGTPPIDLAALVLAAAGEVFADRYEGSRARAAIIAAHSELLERELIKLARLTDALTGALVDRAVPAPTAALTAQLTIAAFHVAFQRWIGSDGGTPMAALSGQVLAELRALAAP